MSKQSIREQQESLIEEARKITPLPSSFDNPQQAKQRKEESPTSSFTEEDPLINQEFGAGQETGEGVVPKKKDKNSSILESLEEDFGIKSVPTFDLKVKNTTFTLRAIPGTLLALISRIADITSVSADENIVRLKFATASCCVSHIDGSPIYSVFGIERKTGELLDSEHYPPVRMMEESALAFHAWLTSSSRTALIEVLYNCYNEKIYTSSLLSTELSVGEEGEPELQSLLSTLEEIFDLMPEGIVGETALEELKYLRNSARFASSAVELLLWKELADWLGRNIPANVEDEWVKKIEELTQNAFK